MRNRNRIIKIFASVSGLIVVDKLIGFVKQMIVASAFGATTETDIINLSQSAVTDIQYILSQALITAFITIYIHVQQGEGGSIEKSKQFAGDSIKAFSIISFILTGILFFASGILARVLAPSYTDELSRQLSFYIKLYSLIILLFTLICIFKAVLNANKNFIPEQLVSFNQSVITIAITIIFGTLWGAKSLVISFFVFTIWNTIYLGVLCRKHVVINTLNPIKNPDIVSLFKMIGPLLLGYSLIYVNQMVDRMLVSGLGGGVITALTYGAVLSNLITTFITTFCSIIFSYITTEISTNNYDAASSIVGISVRNLSVLFMPITITFIICSHEIVSIVYGRGAFGDNAVNSASLALKGYAVMFVPVILREIYSRFQYAFKDSKRPMINGSIGIVGNIILSIIFCHYLGVFGVALATSISVFVSAVLNMISAKNISKDLDYNFLKKFSIKFSAITVLSLILSVYTYHAMISVNSLFRLIVIFLSSITLFAIFFGKNIVMSFKEIKYLQQDD